MGQRMVFAFLIVSLIGCTQGSKESGPHGEVLQTALDFSVAQDRAKCSPHGVKYIGSAGAYAAYEVTDATSGMPYLECPDAVAPEPNTYTMLCGAAGYFRRSDTSRLPGVDQTLMTHAPGKAESRLAELNTSGNKVGTCLRAKDFFSQRVPPSQPVIDSGVVTPTDSGVYVPPPGTNDPDAPYGGVRLYLNGDTQEGDVHFVRMIGINLDKQQHNPSHFVPPICCNEYGCEVNTLPEPPTPTDDGGGYGTGTIGSDGGGSGYDASVPPPPIIF